MSRRDRVKDTINEGSSGALVFSEAAKLPTKHGLFEVRVIQDPSKTEHVIVYKGEIEGADALSVRLHSECLTSEVFESLRCDCNQQLAWALEHIEKQGAGLLIYLRQEGRGIGLFNKIRAYALQDSGLDTVEANNELGFPGDLRTYEVAVDILKSLGIRSINLITNNPRKLDALRKHGIEVMNRIPVQMTPNAHNCGYLKVKSEKLDHLL